MKKKSVRLLTLLLAGSLFLSGCAKTSTTVTVAKNPIEVSQTYVSENVLHKVTVTESDRPFIVDGVSEYKIIVGEGAKTQKAVSYLVKYLEKATDCYLEYATADEYTADGKYIVFNVPELFEKAGLSMPEENLSKTGYYIKSVNDSVFITSLKEVGAQFAMLAFLRQVVGFTMYSGDTYVFEKDGSTLPDMEIIERPDMEYFDINNAIGSTEADYMMGGNAMSFIQIDERSWHNTLNYLPMETYSETHPKWYSTSGDDLCFTAHGDEKELNLMVSEVATKALQLVKENPEKNFISIGIMDTSSACGCEACSASAEKYNSSNAAALIQFINRVNRVVQAELQKQADAAGTEKRELEIYTMAYRKYENPPVIENADGTYSAIDETVICDENVHIMYAPINAKYTSSFLEDMNDIYNQMSKKWNAISDGAYTWIYETNFSYYMYPYNSWSTQLDTFRVLVDNESMAFMSQGQWDNNAQTGFTDFKDYINSCAIFDSSTSFAEIKKDYFANVYLEAGPVMEQYFDELYAYMTYLEETYPAEYSGGIYDNIAQEKFWSYGLLTHWLSYIDKAYEAIEIYKEQQGLYERLYQHITLESLFIRFALIEHHSGKFSSQELEEMQLAFYEDCIQYNVTKEKEHRTIEGVFTRWGLDTN